MGFFDKVRKTFGAYTRDDICDSLRSLGIDAQMVARGHKLEQLGLRPLGSSSGVIRIPKGPISWVHMHEVVTGWSTHDSRHYVYFTDYGVADSRLGIYRAEVEIDSVRVKKVPLVGKVVDLRWEGEDFGLGIISRLDRDLSIREAIIRSWDMKIRAHSEHKCWIMSTETWQPPSAELWSCYQVIAGHLLAEWPQQEAEWQSQETEYPSQDAKWRT